VTNLFLEAANKGLTDLEEFIESARDLLVNMAEDVQSHVPPCVEKTNTIIRIQKIRSKLSS
jgi:hypothetical protein